MAKRTEAPVGVASGATEIEKIENGIKSKRGGRRPGSGRKPGVPNKVTAEIKAIAQNYGEVAIYTLFGIATDKEAPPQARVAAANALLDRGYGKPTQTVEGTGEGGSIVMQVITGVPRGNDDDPAD